MAPLLPMYTLGHNFVSAPIHAGGLRHHGAGVIVSQLLRDQLIEAVAHDNIEVLRLALVLLEEGIIPAPEASHGIATVIGGSTNAKRKAFQKSVCSIYADMGILI